MSAIKAQQCDRNVLWLVGGGDPDALINCDRIIRESGLANVRNGDIPLFSGGNVGKILATLRLHGYEVEE